jgi:hypothetical protein
MSSLRNAMYMYMYHKEKIGKINPPVHCAGSTHIINVISTEIFLWFFDSLDLHVDIE